MRQIEPNSWNYFCAIIAIFDFHSMLQSQEIDASFALATPSLEAVDDGSPSSPLQESQTGASAEKSAPKTSIATSAETQKPYVVGSELELSGKVNNGGLQFESPNKDYRYHVGALIQQDYAFFSQDPALKSLPGSGQGPSGGVGDLQDSVFFRRGRIRFDGVAHDVIEWDFDCELLANNSIAFDDLWVGTTNLPIVGNVRAGHVKIPMGIESITSNRVFTFVERDQCSMWRKQPLQRRCLWTRCVGSCWTILVDRPHLGNRSRGRRGSYNVGRQLVLELQLSSSMELHPHEPQREQPFIHLRRSRRVRHENVIRYLS